MGIMTHFTDQDVMWMQRAMQWAEHAATQDEVPVGAVLVTDQSVIAEGFNCPISTCDPTAHAEMMVLRQGAKKINNYRLINTTLYVTLEPCLMCLGAMVHARIARLVFGAFDPKVGAVQNIFQMQNNQKLNHRLEYTGGLFKDQCGKILSDFFKNRR
jgi:tRNA(adenine34) deaminase